MSSQVVQIEMRIKFRKKVVFLFVGRKKNIQEQQQKLSELETAGISAPLLAAEHFRLLSLGYGTACYRRLRRHRLWRPPALDSRRFCSL